MATFETNGDGRATNPSGVYRHKETGQEMWCTQTSKFGNPQADAAVRLGFEYVGPVPSEAPKTVDPHAAPVATPMGVETVADLKAKLADAEAREKEAQARIEELQKQGLADKPKATRGRRPRGTDSQELQADEGTEVNTSETNDEGDNK